MSNDPKNPFAQGEERPGHFSARVPERVKHGVYSNAQIILDSPKEFVIDFMQGLSRPSQVGARVVITPQTMMEFIAALQQNVDAYTQQFGPPPPAPPPPDRRPTLEEIYDIYKLDENMHSGVYANAVMLGHSQTEFLFDFITSFYPTPSVAARVILPAVQGPRFLNTLKGAMQQFQQRYVRAAEQQQQQQPPQQQPPQPPPPTP